MDAARRVSRAATVSLLLAIMSLGMIRVAQADTVPFADPGFQRVWEAADAPVASGAFQRSWLWGPKPIGAARDFYTESTAPDSLRLVQFFDKARMEITYPDQDPSSIWYVTNGLLVKELVSGDRQHGDSYFVQNSPAYIQVAGDENDYDTPTYASFGGVATLDGTSNRATNEIGLALHRQIDADGNVSDTNPPVPVTVAYYEPTLGHNIPDVMWYWMNNPANGITTYGSWIYPMGLPISEAYWIKANVDGVEHAILVQLFERRILTYTPDNDPAWRIEMGNVGRAYLRWFEQPRNDRPIWSPDSQRLVFTSTRAGNDDIYMVNADGSRLTQLTNSPYDESATDWLPNGKIVYRSVAEQVDALMNPDGSRDQALPLWFTIWAPDGTQFAYSSTGDQGLDIRVRNADGSNDHLVATDGGYCNGYLSWSPNSQQLAYCKVNRDDPNNVIWSVHVVNADGSDDREVLGSLANTYWVERVSWAPDNARLVVEQVLRDDSCTMFIVQADGSGAEQLTVAVDSNIYITPDWSPISDEIVFGTGFGAYVVNADGSNLRQLTTDFSSQLRWSPDGRLISFIDWIGALAVVNADGSNLRVIDTPTIP